MVTLDIAKTLFDAAVVLVCLGVFVGDAVVRAWRD